MNKTGNPVGSKAFLDFEDNVRILDQRLTSDQDTFQDRLGKSRLTWAGIVKAGSGDPAIAVDAAARAEAAASQVQQDAEQIAQDAAEQAVQDVVAGVDGQVAVAQSAADRAEAASATAFVNADVYPTVAEGRAAVAVGEQFQVLSESGLEYIRYRKDDITVASPVARTLTPSGVAHVTGALLESSIHGVNLFDPADAEVGVGVSGSHGGLTGGSTLFATGFIPVVPGGDVVLSHDSFTNGFLGYAFYSAGKEFVSGEGALLPANTPIEVPSGAYFFRCTFPRLADRLIGRLMISSSLGEAYAIPGRPELMDTLRELDVRVALKLGTLNLFNPEDCTDGAAIINGVVTSSANWFVSGFIPVTPGTTLVANGTGGDGSTVGVHCYNAQRQLILISDRIVSGEPFLVPDATVFVRINFAKATSPAPAGTMVVTGDSLPPEFIPFGVGGGGGGSAQSRWQGKKFIVFGDSISSVPTAWPFLLRDELGIDLVNRAGSGTRTRQSLGFTTEAEVASREFAIIAHGTNDFKLETPLGDIDDPAVIDTTFYGDYKNLIETLISWNPQLKIMLFTPIRRTQPAGTGTDTNALGFKLIDYVSAVKEIAGLYALPVNDQYNESGLSALNMATWTTDGLHPTPEGQVKFLAGPAVGFLNSV